MKKLKPLPLLSDQAVQDQIVPYLNSLGKNEKDNVFTHNRAKELNANNENSKDFSISLQDIDKAILYYFENIIKPSVIQNGQRINVPITYGDQEIWKSIQQDGYYRDKTGKLMLPFISFKRDSFEKNRNLSNKLDGNQVNLYRVFQKQYNKTNNYDKFDLLNNRKPVQKFIVTTVPDYVDITYTCVIFTEYISQINPIIEAINFASDSYWGDLKRFKFRAQIDSFNTTTELNLGDDRISKSEFSIKVYGYLIPDTINKKLATENAFYSKATMVFGLETTTEDLKNEQFTSKLKAPSGASGFVDSYNVSINTIVNVNADMNVLTYLNTNFAVQGNVSTPNTIIFNKGWVPAPNPLPATSLDNFMFFCNGQFIEKTNVISFTESLGTSTLIIDTNLLGYSFESSDTVIGIGKFTN